MKKHIVKFFATAVLGLALVPGADARRFSVSTNILDYANLGTLNLETSYAFDRKWTVNVGAKYNPWTFKENLPGQFQSRQQTYDAGVRFWPWHSYSGWWIAGKVQYQEYNTGGIRSRRTEEGDRVGAGVSAGYTLMLHPNLNMEFGVGLWAGKKWYTVYSCPTCGLTVESGKKAFLLPNDLIVSLTYVF